MNQLIDFSVVNSAVQITLCFNQRLDGESQH